MIKKYRFKKNLGNSKKLTKKVGSNETWSKKKQSQNCDPNRINQQKLVPKQFGRKKLTHFDSHLYYPNAKIYKGQSEIPVLVAFDQSELVGSVLNRVGSNI